MLPTERARFLDDHITPQILAQINERRWRTQALNREVFDPPRLFVAKSPVTLHWYDPVTDQMVEIGQIFGVFPAQAQLRCATATARRLRRRTASTMILG